jgi:hypothetical protein
VGPRRVLACRGGAARPAAVPTRRAGAADRGGRGRRRGSGRLRAALPAEAELLGPLPADGRQGFLCKTADRRAVLAALRPVRERWSLAGVEARVDVDPVDAL